MMMNKSKEILNQLGKDFKIEVNHSGLVELQYIPDPPDGNLTIAEVGKNIPFDIKRVYLITDLERAGALRGKHAHRELEQLIICVSGSFDLFLDDGERQQIIQMTKSPFGIRLVPRLWHEMTNFSSDCAILVLAADFYDENDYVRDYQEFLDLIREKTRF